MRERAPGRERGWRGSFPREAQIFRGAEISQEEEGTKKRNWCTPTQWLHPLAAATLTCSPQLTCRKTELVPGLLRLFRGSKVSVRHALSFIMHVRHCSGSALESRAAALVKPSCGRGACCNAEGQRNWGAAPTPCLLAGLPLHKRKARATHLLWSWAPKGIAACSHLGLCPSRLHAEMC